MIYPYTSRDPQPEYYMFSAYGGYDFLRAFIQARGQLLDDLRANWEQFPEAHAAVWADWGWLTVLTPNPNWLALEVTLPTAPPVVELPALTATCDTLQLTDRLLAAVVDPHPAQTALVGEWQIRLLSRFEITRRLYPNYTSAMRPLGDPCPTLALHVRLAVALAAQYLNNGDLRLMNTVLKLNDLIGARRAELQLAELIWLAALAVNLEQAGVAQLAKRHEVAL